MQIHYYFSIYPLEALIASQLNPDQFGLYMSIGKKNGSYERTMFIEIEGRFGDFFRWEEAEKRCVPHTNGSPKHSVWVSVYRTLEHVDLERLGPLYMTTTDGRTLKIEAERYAPPHDKKDYYIYQELCPVRPLIVSSLDPQELSQVITNQDNMVSVPKIVFADLRVADLDNYEDTGNIGGAYDKNLQHLKEYIRAVKGRRGKPTKNVERSVASFSYQIIDRGVYIGQGKNLVHYLMPSREELKSYHYQWARSAMIF